MNDEPTRSYHRRKSALDSSRANDSGVQSTPHIEIRCSPIVRVPVTKFGRGRVHSSSRRDIGFGLRSMEDMAIDVRHLGAAVRGVPESENELVW